MKVPDETPKVDEYLKHHVRFKHLFKDEKSKKELKELQEVCNKNIEKYNFPPFNVFSKDKEGAPDSAQNKLELLDLLLKQGKKGINVQRYKGLGEMNPDQLWKTTMDPEKRVLLQVMIEDVVDTDEIFTILMGEEVEPRRDFIQNNALEVSTLDI